MVRFTLLVLILVLVGCANISTPPLASVHPNDPTWQPAQDHLVGGALPQ